MGYFGKVWIMQLEEREGTVKNTVEHIEFRGSQYISWEGKNLPETEWIPKGKQTLFLKRDGFDPKQVTVYPLTNITPVNVGVARTHTEYRLETSNICDGEMKVGLMHMVLPDYFIPEKGSFTQLPTFKRKQESMLALTWIFDQYLTMSFRFRKANAKEFYDYKAVGIPDIQRVDPERLRKLKSAGEIIKLVAEYGVELGA